MMTDLNLILIGAITMAALTVSLFFLSFWKTTHDRFFLFFAISFLLEGMSRLILAVGDFADEQEPLIYTIRLLAFLVILFAIIDKNWIKGRKSLK